MTTVITYSILPGYEKARYELMPGETITHFLDRAEWDFKLPTICVVNGQPVLRGKWASTIVLPTDKVEFLSKPWGGGGGSSGGGKTTQILGIVAVIALAAVAPWAAGVIGGALGFGATGIAALTAVIGIGGSLLISTFLKPNAGGAVEDTDKTAQLYSLTAASNTAKPLQPINVPYGRMKIICDYASSPYSEYIGDEQYLNVPMCVGVGTYTYEALLMDDTVLWDSTNGYNSQFSGVDIAFYDPGVPVTLFPLNIVNADEVSNVQLPNWSGTEWVGGFIVNDWDVPTNALSFDFALPGGLFTTNDDGQTVAKSVTIQAQVRRVDIAGTPIESYTTVFTELLNYATRQPKRFTKKVEGLPEGRYEVRVRRDNAEATDGKTADTVVWVGLRVHIVGPESFEHTSTAALRIRASAQLSNSSSKQFSVIVTRELPVWNGSTFVTAPTKNPVWAFLDMATNTVYGADRPLSKIDFQKIITEAAAADARGDEFNYNFTQVTTFQKAFDIALATTRCKHCWAGDVLTLVRDEWKPIPSMLLTDQQIVRGSLEIEYVFNDEDSADAVIGEYLNDETWKPVSIQYPPNDVGFTAVNPSRVRIEGITDTAQMYREVAFLYKQAYLRRIKVNFDTEHDGRILKFGSAVKVQSFLPRKWGQSGEVVSYNTGTKIMTVDRELVFTAATQHYIEFRDKRGRYFGPVMCGSVGGEPLQVLINAGDLATVESQQGMTLVDVLARMDGAEPPAFAFGIQTEISRHCIVVSGRPSGDRVTLNCVVDLEDVHDTGLGDLPDSPTGTDLFDPKTPIVGLLYAIFRQGVIEPILDVTWFPAAGALFYRCQVSYDGQNTWEQVYEGIDPKCSVVVSRVASLHVRVAGINDRHGPWSVAGPIEGPSIILGDNVVGPDSLILGLRDYVMNQISRTSARVDEIARLIANNSSEQDFANATEAVRNKETIAVQAGQLSASIEEVSTVAVGTQSAFASYQITVNAALGSLSSSVSTNATAIATLDGQFAASYTLTLDVNNYVSGFESVNDGSFSSMTIIADVFRLAQPGVSGGDPVIPFQVGLVNGTAKMVMKGDLIADGDITGRMINALSINTQHLQVNSVPIDRLIEGAASKVNAYAAASATNLSSPSGLFTILTTGTVNYPVACKIVCTAFASGHGGSSNAYITGNYVPSEAQLVQVGVYVDDVQQGVMQTFTFMNTENNGVIFPMPGYWQLAMVAQAFVTAGNHIITLKARYTRYEHSFANPVPLVQSAYLVTHEARR